MSYPVCLVEIYGEHDSFALQGRTIQGDRPMGIPRPVI